MRIVIFAILALPFFTGAQTAYSNWDHEMIEVIQPDKSGILMDAAPLFSDKWNELDQPQFWKKIMLLSPDSCLINLASNRRVLATMSLKEWHKQSEIQKSIYKNELKALHGIDSNETVFVTTGKNDFYQFQKVYPSIAKGILAFEKYGVDPWYAQAILLIESPGKLAKSSAGAYGAFQLMPGVARAQGLTVNNSIDERKDFDRSAYGASRLIQRVCIPEAKKILNAHALSYSESDLWFRLFVLHVYHAGAMNVKAVVNKINPTEGGQKLITSMWHTSAASFGNSSQNYTQLALASQLILHEMVQGNCVKLFHCFDETSIK
jgi:hypothetical protein